MERCVYNHMYADVIQLISPLQHGFLRKRSCITQLLSVFHNIGQNLDNNTQSDVLYLDLAKAFDSVDHQILVEKLKCYGVAGRLLDWFTDYLNGRTQRVVIDGAVSQWVPVTSGVPQGSILGPLLFVIFINDLPEIIPNGTNTALFADDTKLHRNISSLTDCEGLQQALSNINIWSQQSNMKFNSTKCKVLTITRKQNPVVYDYQLGSAILTRVQQEKDLGVTISSKLTWHHHISVIVAKANKLLGLLKRTCPLLTDIQVRRTLYLSLVKSQLCYATQVWSPAQDMLKAKLERVQRRATKWIFSYKGKEMSYHQRLQLLHLLPLCYDREIKDLTFFYKALYGIVMAVVYNVSSLALPDSEDQALLASLNAEKALSDGEPDQYNLQGLVVHADLADTWKKWVKEGEDGYYYITTYHGASEAGDPCHEVYGKHMHIMLFFPNSKMFNSTAIHNRLQRRACQFKKVLYAHEKVRNPVGLYKYIMTAPRTLVHPLTRLPSWFDEWIDVKTNPKVKPDAIQAYIDRHVKGKVPDFCVNLGDLIELVLRDGCCSFAEWKLVVFRKYPHGSPECETFTKIMSHMRADYLICNCEDYLRNHYMS
ncbi:Hypothetical predicted protein [Paramuricea clavata]|uniref:Uncharacterized protein n=1 Tax=Paramuricea clavata TaxID=317549 RepID=A0A7D9JFV1_PARCT|nr:Hypothetical predicted protein [Paramuricea clavata]